MDGNGRWATAQEKSRLEGHTKGSKVALEIMEYLAIKKIPYVSVYTLSLQNLKRPEKEIKHILKVFKNELPKIIDICKKTNSKLVIAGDKSLIDEELLNLVSKCETDTSQNTGTTFSVCLFYGGREEIVNIVKSLDEVTESKINEKIGPNVDLIIRTGGDRRISNFLVWQAAYAELFFTNTLWPDFTTEELESILTDFSHRNRTFGEVKEHIPDVETVCGCLEELIDEYKTNTQDLESLYSKLSKNITPHRIQGKDSNRKQFLLENSLCDEATVSFLIKVDDFIDEQDIEKQIYYSDILCNLSSESVAKVNPDLQDLFLKINKQDIRYLEYIYKCEYLKLTTDKKEVFRYASNYYFLKLYSNNVLTDDFYLYLCIIISVWDDIFDEETDIPEVKYLNKNVFYTVKGAIFDVYNKHTFIPLINDALYVASSVVIDKYVRRLGEFQNMSECFHYLKSMWNKV